MRCAAVASCLLFSSLALGREAPVEREPLLDGTHFRFTTDRGPVHLWRPPRYDRRTAGLVVYVHGWYTDVDQAWNEHKLAEQFARSEQNALFIVPEAPAGPEDGKWPVLDELLTTVFRRIKLSMPAGPLVVVGHSGAYRVIVPWLSDPRVQHILLIDALYGNEDEFGAWLDGAAATPISAGTPPHKLTVVAKGTVKWTEPFVEKRSYAEICDAIPETFEEFTPRQRTARLLYLRSQYEHMELMSEGKTLPILLRRTALHRLAPATPPTAPAVISPSP